MRKTPLMVMAAVMWGAALGVSLVHGQEAEPLRLGPEEAVSLAYGASPQGRSLQRQLKAAQAAERWRYAVLLPQARLEGALFSDQPEAVPWEYRADGVLSLSLSAGQVLNIREQGLVLEEVRADAAEYEAALRSQVLRSYYRLLLTAEERRLLEDQVQSAKARLEAAEYDYERGRISEYDYLLSRLALRQLQPRLEKKRIEEQSARDRFALLLGLAPGRRFQLSETLMPEQVRGETDREDQEPAAGNNGEVSELPASEPVFSKQPIKAAEEADPGALQAQAAYLAAENPQLDILQAELARNGFELQTLQSRFLPEASVSIHQGYRQELSGDTGQAYLLGGYELSVSFTVNDLLPWSDYRRSRERLQRNRDRLRRTVLQQRQETEIELRSLLEQLDQAEDDIAAAELSLQLAQRFVRIAEEEWENGIRSSLELENARVQRQEAQLALLQAYYNRIDLHLSLQELSGGRWQGCFQ